MTPGRPYHPVYSGDSVDDIRNGDIHRHLSEPGTFVWVALKGPPPDELDEMQREFGLHEHPAYAALVAVPTMIAGIYGMNFDNMPELKWDGTALAGPTAAMPRDTDNEALPPPSEFSRRRA